MTIRTITREQFQAYRRVQSSGVTNMFDVRRVVEEADGELTRGDVIAIAQQYGRLMSKYGRYEE